MVGGVGQRVLAGVAKKTAGIFFAAIDDVLTGARTVAEVPAAHGPAVATAAPSGRRQAGPISPASTAPVSGGLSLVGAAAFGAISMLVGVVVGARIARRAP